MTTPLLETIELESAANPTAAVIWLHGLGADGGDFVPIVKELDLDGCAPIRFIFPTAPTMPVTINGGYVMRAWYDIVAPSLVVNEDETGLRASQHAIEQLIAREIARGIPAERIVLAGFSQGCAMTLHTGLRYPHKLAGLLCLSGYLPLRSLIAAERNPANQHTPILMAHGNADGVVAPIRAEQSRDVLTGLGYQIDWRTYPMPHSVCPEEVSDIGHWLQQVLPSAPSAGN
ncbi:carboxylesterase [Herbaspirillum sp. RTI4]|uniref:alpha/beta hydrolase n=1 Tax=Herbaspirillum sp. RTI4 TaxID=3048640 RepID=UPI002AB4EDE2|nr:carboxylesterase [Herbaspirillum sp. RTI4]MDY7579490.1 carboxylesterase [Herbaspirillum sp. RTI4]MEA9980404.1 carboxylesterase [Herbaspirillum sp. RTI4]